MYKLSLNTPVGILTLFSDGEALREIRFGKTDGEDRSCPLLTETESQLNAYFNGKRRDFTVPLAPEGTPFQRSVWDALKNIPYGETRSYSEIAAALGKPAACRAVGSANHVNPIPVIIPCHRVIGKNGGLTGYAGGLSIKEKLLALERNTCQALKER